MQENPNTRKTSAELANNYVSAGLQWDLSQFPFMVNTDKYNQVPFELKQA